VVQLAAEKDKLIAELNAQKDHLTTRNEEQAAEIESLKEQLSERESSQALLALKGSGLQSTQSGKVSSFFLRVIGKHTCCVVLNSAALDACNHMNTLRICKFVTIFSNSP
jgi:predicted RNase H-like nuclease (RuvC/YqgF family)